MDNKYKNFAKMRLYNVLLECEAVEITPEELYEELSKSKISLVEKTIDTMFTQMSKRIAKLLVILRVMVKLLESATLVLEKDGYNVETEKKTLEYVNAILLQKEKTPQPPAPEPLILAKG